jgi:DNA-binding NarL/FixJ family response regulator
LQAGNVNTGSCDPFRRELYISDTMVKTHITHILMKLSLRDRVQAVVLAYAMGLFDSH